VSAKEASSFRRAWEEFNACAPVGCRMSKSQFANFVLKTEHLFKPWVFTGAKAWLAINPGA
jgi:hypothetical protein